MLRRPEAFSELLKNVFDADYYEVQKKVNPASPKNYRDAYTPEMIKIVENKFSAELTLAGYDFDGPTDDEVFIEPSRLDLRNYPWYVPPAPNTSSFF